MSKKQQMTLSLDADAAEILKEEVSNRKRGEFISQVIREWRRNKEKPPRAGVLEEIREKIEELQRSIKNT
ncbi:MAG: hypothetical protein KDE46_07050 [Caldilineaceae bacterium]|nr:hypothetical protein [Caldilineaceae bacterium]